MPKSCTTDSTPTPTVSRRSLAGGAAVLLGMAGNVQAADTAAASSPDAELIQLCAAFDKLTAEYNATDFSAFPNTPEGEFALAEQARISDLQDVLLGPICALRATTLTGFLTLARTLTRWDSECAKPDEAYCYVNDRLAATLLRSMTGRA